MRPPVPLAAALICLACAEDAAPIEPVEVAARQRVTFRIVGPTGAWAALEGSQCDPAAFARRAGAAWAELTLTPPFLCLCECNPPGYAPGVSRWQRLDPSTPATFTWDARALTAYPRSFDCGSRFGGAPTVTYNAYAAQPVAPGRYRATFGVRDGAPTDCTVEGGSARCGYTPVGRSSPGDYVRCASPRTVSVEFDLPASGDLTVDVMVPAA